MFRHFIFGKKNKEIYIYIFFAFLDGKNICLFFFGNKFFFCTETNNLICWFPFKKKEKKNQKVFLYNSKPNNLVCWKILYRNMNEGIELKTLSSGAKAQTIRLNP